MKRLTLLGMATLLVAGCSIDKNLGGPVMLQITKVQAAAGGDVLLSDVLTGTAPSTTITDDLAVLNLAVVASNPDTAVETASGAMSAVVLQSYRVHYFRSDNHNTAGLDVPYDIAGSLSGNIAVGASGTATIEIVRHTAKNEPPLRTLVNSGGEDVITVIAQITVYGQTVGGVSVSATASLEIKFGDFAG